MAHRQALQELEQMRQNMEKMEEERAEMIAEVEAQIERALAHMAVDVEDSDYGGSRPSSRRPEGRAGSRGGSGGLGRWVENRLDWLLDDSDDWPEPWQESARRRNEAPAVVERRPVTGGRHTRRAGTLRASFVGRRWRRRLRL